MSTTAAKPINPYGGARRVRVGLPLLPARYARHEGWKPTARAIASDLLLLRRSAPQLFSAIAHCIADAAAEERRRQRNQKRHLQLYEGSQADPWSETAMAARLRLLKAIDTAVEEGELSLLELLAAGYTGVEIGHRLGIPAWEARHRIRDLRLQLREG